VKDDEYLLQKKEKEGKMDRVRIGCNYEKQPRWKVLLAVPLIYLPIFTTIPFVAIDRSFWQVDPEELEKLHPDDKQNPIWNEKGEG